MREACWRGLRKERPAELSHVRNQINRSETWLGEALKGYLTSYRVSHILA